MKKVFSAMKIAIAVLMALVLFTSCGFGSVDKLKDSNQQPLEAEEAEPDIENDDFEAPEETTASANELSDKYDSFQFMIFDEVYTLPMTVEDFTAMGWKCEDDLSGTLKANSYAHADFYKNNVTVYVEVCNFDVNAKEASDCYVSGVRYTYADDNVVDFYIPGGFKVGESKADDIMDAWGTVKSEEMSTYNYYYYYQFVNNEKVYNNYYYFSADKTSGILLSAECHAGEKPENFVDSSGSTEPWYKYTAPATQSTDIGSGVFSYDGALYELPVPLSEFLRNGWTIDNEYCDTTRNTVIPGNSYASVYLNYAGDYGDKGIISYWLTVYVYNTTDTANIAANCLIKSISFSAYSEEGINSIKQKIGFAFPIASKSQADKALAELNITPDNSSENKDGELRETLKFSKVVSDSEIKYEYELKYVNGSLYGFSAEVKAAS